MRVDESRHDDPPADVLDPRVRDEPEALPRRAVPGRDDLAVARGDPPVVERADVAGGRADARALLAERRDGEQARAVKDEVGLPIQ
jgi:hypothetical protein